MLGQNAETRNTEKEEMQNTEKNILRRHAENEKYNIKGNLTMYVRVALRLLTSSLTSYRGG